MIYRLTFKYKLDSYTTIKAENLLDLLFKLIKNKLEEDDISTIEIFDDED